MKKQVESDETRIRQMAAGDPDALVDMMNRYQDVALSLAYRNTQNWTDAEDIVQESFLRIFKSAAHYQGQSSFKTWLYRIVVNLCIDHQRKKKTGVSLDTTAMDISAQAESDPLETQETAAIVQKAVHELPERQRVALILHRYENLSHAQISETTGWSRSSVESLLVRAYENLRNKLEGLKND